MLDIAAVLAGVAVLTIPGIGLWAAFFPEHGIIRRCTWGATAGLALAVSAAFYLAYLRLSLFWPVWLVCCAVSLVLAWMRRRKREQAEHDGTAFWLATILAVVAVSRFAPTFLRDTPPGWDPAFHLILARKLQLAGFMVHDWAPFETVPLNYPLGSHLLTVVLAGVTRLPLHRVFQLLIPALGVITTAQVYALAERVFRRSEVGLYAALAYGAWAFAGSIGYYTWGGLPNQLGMMFLVGVFAVLVEAGWDWRRMAAAALFLGAIFITHHHVTVVATAVMAACVMYFFAAGDLEAWTKTRGLLLAGILAVALASPYLVPHLLRATEIRNTAVLRFTEPHSFSLMIAQMGIVLVACAVAGIVACRREDRKRAGVLLAAASALVLLYLACGPLYRVFSLHRWGREYVAFTPSRFLTDLVYLLSIFAGYALYRVAERYRLRRRVVIAAGLVVALTNIPFWMEVFAREPDPERRQAYAWIEQHTPAEAIVLTPDPWAPYSTWRRTPETPLPVSEPRVMNTPARQAAAALANGRSPESAVVVKVIAPGGVTPKGVVMWRSPSGWTVVQVWPEAQANAAAR